MKSVPSNSTSPIPNVQGALHLAAQHHQRGDLQNALTAYRQVLQIAPENADALHLLGLVEYQLGRHETAADLIRRALKTMPASPIFHCNLGTVLLAQGCLPEADRCFQQAVRLKPDYAEAHNNLGVALMQQGSLGAASASCERALAIRPDYAQAHYNLGLVLQKQGKVDKAISSYERALEQTPNHADAHNDLGIALQDQGRVNGAIAHYEAALALMPRHAGAHNNLGTALQDQGRFDEAVGQYEQALRLAPAMANAHFNLGRTLLERCEVEQAIACFERAQELEPSDRNRVAIAMALAPIITSAEDLLASRERISQALGRLLETKLTLADPLKQGLTPATLLAYHGLDNRPLHQALAEIYAKACPSLSWTASHCQERRVIPHGGKIRIGFLSRYFYNHTVGEVTRGLIEHIDRNRFDVTVFRIGREDDHISRAIDATADHLIRLPHSLPGAREVVAEQRLDALVFPEIGMDPGTYFLAFSRLAPIQCVMWGHPDTSGIPAVDYYLSAADAEQPNAQDHYSEKLIKLPYIPAYYYRPPIAADLADRATLGLPEDAHLYVCPQTGYKFHPDFDVALGEILRRDPQGVLVLFHGRRPVWTEILKARFRRAFPGAAERVLFMPRVALSRYLTVLRHASVVLDTFHFGGGNTAFQAFSQGVPVVTLPGAFARGRITYALYRKMGILDLVAENADHYIQLALKLGTDSAFRNDMTAAIARKSNIIFENTAAVREFERFFEANAIAAC